MSVVEQDLDPDSTTGTEFVIDSEEERIKECEEMWKDMENCQYKWSLIGTETLTNSNAQLSLLMMQVECLTSELKQWQSETPEVIPLTDGVLTTLGKEELQKLKHDLEILPTLQSKNKKLKEDIERIANEMKTKILSIKEFKEKFFIALGEFLEDHFPLPSGKTKRKKKNIESTAELITLNEIIETLINGMFDIPHDPYVQISDSFWPPYVELLLRNWGCLETS
ncbi:centromere protein K-like [Perognathus longimembris pacificus]|uniref:centromere protein K-like n=1 Tax=Perognathus longimembris pacificus TaxID=214514 RepID=UPI002018E3ED|nr:centromere protein K-like [Perognathus longimembris pacificus]